MEVKKSTMQSYDKEEFSVPKEQIRRKKRRKKRPSKAIRYISAILVIVLVFFIAYSIGSWLIGNFDSETNEEVNKTEDAITQLQKRLDELTSENKLLNEEIRELQTKIDIYNSLYGPLDNMSSEENVDQENDTPEQSGNSTETNSSDSNNQDNSNSVPAEQL